MKYYYLATYLPELAREDKKLRLRMADLLGDSGFLAPEDRREVDLVLLAGDVLMVERLLAGHPLEVPLSLHDLDYWREQVKSPVDAPEFMAEVIKAAAGGEFGPRQVDRLWAGYYDHVLGAAKNRLLKAYIAFERDVRNIQAAARARRQGLNLADHLVGESDLAALLGRSNAEDFGLAREHPWLEKLLAAKDPSRTRELMEQVLWDFFEQNAGADPFAFDAILAYLIKLSMVEKRLALDENAGMELVRQLEEA